MSSTMPVLSKYIILLFLSKLIQSIYLWVMFESRKEKSLQILDFVYIFYPVLCSLFIFVNQHVCRACLFCRKI